MLSHTVLHLRNRYLNQQYRITGKTIYTCNPTSGTKATSSATTPNSTSWVLMPTLRHEIRR